MHSLDFIEATMIGSKSDIGAATSSLYNAPPIFLSDGGWARVNYNGDLAGASLNTIHFSNRNGSISGSMSACTRSTNFLDLISRKFQYHQ